MIATISRSIEAVRTSVPATISRRSRRRRDDRRRPRCCAQIRADPELENGLLNAVEDPPIILVDEIVEVDADTVPEIRPGLAFFPAARGA